SAGDAIGKADPVPIHASHSVPTTVPQDCRAGGTAQVIIPIAAPDGDLVHVVEDATAVWPDDMEVILCCQGGHFLFQLGAMAAVVLREAAGVDDEVPGAAFRGLPDQAVHRGCGGGDEHQVRAL